MSGLGRDAAAVYRSLAVYPEDTPIPARAITRRWAARRSEDELRELITELAERKLLSFDARRDAVSLHDLQRNFLLLQTERLSLLHAELLAAYRSLLAGDRRRWAQPPRDEPLHLGAPRLPPARRRRTRRDPSHRYRSRLPGDAQHDRRAPRRRGRSAPRRALHPGHAALGWLAQGLAQWGHLFASLDDPVDVAATLASRIHDAPDSIDRLVLDALLPPNSPSPAWARRAPAVARSPAPSRATPTR